MAVPTRLPVTVDATGTPRTTSTPPLHQERFTDASVADPKLLSQQLTRLVKAVDDGTKAARAHPAAQSRTFEDIDVEAAGYTFQVSHGLGHAVKWRVVRWRSQPTGSGTIAGVDLYEASQDADVLILVSGARGRLDLEVY